MREAAEALGRTILTFKKWVREGTIPPPIYEDTSYGYLHYSEGELQTIARVLARHFETYDYLHKTHNDTIHRIWQSLEAYRRKNRES